MSRCVRRGGFNQWIMKNGRYIKFLNSSLSKEILQIFFKGVFFLTGMGALMIFESIMSSDIKYHCVL